MHMADALISPVVGGTMLAATACVAAYSVRKIRIDQDSQKVPLMGVMGAFVFAAQMINFSIPATGSSGHLGGGMLLAILLGPQAGFLTMAAILLIQALFFGDGGLLAFGCNVFNMGFYTCFLAYPLIYRWMTRKGLSSGRIFGASMVSSVIGLQLGAFSVVLETLFSGKTELPFGTFVMLMQPIHLAIGIVEGLVTASIATFVWKARPELLDRAVPVQSLEKGSRKKVLAVILAAAVIIGGFVSWFASSDPDGLEWSMERTAGTTELQASDKIHEFFAAIQEKTAFLPDYSFKSTGENSANSHAETSVSGIVGGTMTLGLAAAAGIALTAIKKKRRKASE